MYVDKEIVSNLKSIKIPWYFRKSAIDMNYVECTQTAIKVIISQLKTSHEIVISLSKNY